MKATNLQDLFLNTVRRDRTPVTVYLLSGYQLRGTVRGLSLIHIKMCIRDRTMRGREKKGTLLWELDKMEFYIPETGETVKACLLYTSRCV